MDASDYTTLIAAFVHGDISASEFEQRYLRMFKNETRVIPGELYIVLNELFTDVDAFCGNPMLRGRDDLDEAQLRERAKIAYETLLLFPIK
jgi:hypothetical protein